MCRHDGLAVSQASVLRVLRDEGLLPEVNYQRERRQLAARRKAASMNVLLQALEREGLVTRPAAASVGRVLPARLTPRGRRSLKKASVAVRSVEVRMLAGLTETERSGAFRILRSMIDSLCEGDDGS